MKRMILNSRITWIILPLVLTGLMVVAVLRARQPLSDRAVDRLIDQLYQNAINDPLVPWSHMVQYNNLMLQTETLRSISDFFHGQEFWLATTHFDDLVVRAEEKPELFAKIETAGFANVSAFIEVNPRAVFVFDNIAYPGFEWRLLSLGAVTAARAGDNDKALSRLRMLTRLTEMSLARFTGTTTFKPGRLYSVFDEVAAETTSPAHLRRLSEELEQTRSLQQPTRPSINATFSQFVYRMKFEPELTDRPEIVKTIAKSAIMLIIQPTDESAWAMEFGWNESHNIDVGLILPWTRTPYLLQKNLNDLAEHPALVKPAPSSYLEGLSKNERLMATALLIAPHEDRKASYMTDRAMATQRRILQAALLARVYQAELGAMPTRLEDLADYGFVPPVPTDIMKLKQILYVMREKAHAPDRDVPLGPLEIVKVVPDSTDVDQWLDGEKMVLLESASDADEGSTLSRRLISLAPNTNFKESPGYEANLRNWIERLDSRPDVKVTSFTVSTDEPGESENSLQHWENDPWRRKVRASVEFIAATQITKIYLRDPDLNQPIPGFSSGQRPGPVYLAPPVP